MNDGVIFISIGLPHFSGFPMMNRVKTYFDPRVETPVQVAKKLRKDVAEHPEHHGWVRGTKFLPSELYFIIYNNIDDEEPIAQSANAELPLFISKTFGINWHKKKEIITNE